MDKRIDKIINDFISALAQNNPGLVTTFLFGSYAKEKQNEDSDIDLALIIAHLRDEENFDVQVQLMVLASQFDIRIEPHPISNDDFNSNTPFVSEIKRTGIEIKPPRSTIAYKP